MNTTKLFLKTGEDLLTAEEGGINQLQQQWFGYLENLKQETGEAWTQTLANPLSISAHRSSISSIPILIRT